MDKGTAEEDEEGHVTGISEIVARKDTADKRPRTRAPSCHSPTDMGRKKTLWGGGQPGRKTKHRETFRLPSVLFAVPPSPRAGHQMESKRKSTLRANKMKTATQIPHMN